MLAVHSQARLHSAWGERKDSGDEGGENGTDWTQAGQGLEFLEL